MSLKPTDTELEILQVLWEKGPLTVRQVNDRIREDRMVGYTTTLKIMQIMTDKGILERDTHRRSHVYKPAMDPETVQETMMEHMLRTVYRGNRSTMILQALGTREVSEGELREIKTLIDQLEKERNGTL